MNAIIVTLWVLGCMVITVLVVTSPQGKVDAITTSFLILIVLTALTTIWSGNET